MTALKLLKPQDVADRLGCSRSTAYRLLESAAIEVTYVMSLPRVTEEALAAYVKRSTVPARSSRRPRAVAS